MGEGRSRLRTSVTEGIPPTTTLGRGEGQCSEEGEVTAVGGGARSDEEMRGLRSEGRGPAVVPSPPQQLWQPPGLVPPDLLRAAWLPALLAFLFGGVWAAGASPLEPPSHPSLTPSPHARIPISLPNVRPSSSREMYVEKSRERALGKALILWGLQQGGIRRRDQGKRQGWARPPAAPRQILPFFPPNSRGSREGRRGGVRGRGV